MNKARVEAFSDGIFAILGTLLVLEIGVPDMAHVQSWADFWGAMQPVLPKLFVFALSFVEITSFWINHSFIFKEVQEVDWTTLIYNSLMMLSICLLPFGTALLGDNLSMSYALALYAGILLLISIWFSLLANHINRQHISKHTRWIMGASWPLSGFAQLLVIILAMLHLQYWGIGLIIVMVIYYTTSPALRERLVHRFVH